MRPLGGVKRASTTIGVVNTSERLALFDPLVAEVMAEWRIPGLAMAGVAVNRKIAIEPARVSQRSTKKGRGDETVWLPQQG